MAGVTGALRMAGVGMDFPVRGGDRRVLDDIHLTVAPGEFVCLVGASGSGKSTLLALAAGLLRPTTGAVTLDGEPVTGPGPERGLVFQSGALFPWRTVAGNVAFGLELLPMTAESRARRVDRVLAEVGLAGRRAALPKQLSGGERQRVAIARALVCEPEVLLLDEPFGALDVQTKEDMQILLRRVWRIERTTVVMVTHDVEEAVFLAQRVLVLGSDPGRVLADVPVELPADRDLRLKRSPGFLALRAELEDLVRGQRAPDPDTAGHDTGTDTDTDRVAMPRTG